ncbi:hypothetical protein JRO89_XS07G0013300 [Xanthoceras sorbifolium]|uniref:ornithine decarboxylase n=1 Tax=Xanthoceras sorbifolium TaxID=99658 RepID=A0ABQ8HRZ4_9ROSI|nr:hypothetical protein JRO89_XS07G0013300 [Xanthoceras sorbifolium]
MVSSLKIFQVILGAPGVRGSRVTILTKDSLNLNDFMESIIFKTQKVGENEYEPFYVLDLGVVASLYDKWIQSLPMVHPFYAVKCNPEPALLGALAALGSNFDCASRAEIEAVLALGVSPDRIIYANPCKAVSHIKYAASVGVNLTTFDSREELDKIRKWHPKCALLIRVKGPDDSGARSPLGAKYGALEDEVEPLLQAAQSAQLNVTGVSFHIGSGATKLHAYHGAIAAAKEVFDTAARLGMPKLSVLNIGGGFTADPHFDEAVSVVKSSLQTHFANVPGLNIMSEPGRFFAESAFTLATNIIGKRVRGDLREYWINDGIYGSMNCIVNDSAIVTCMPLTSSSKVSKNYSSTVFGPTCDAFDTVLKEHQLPELRVSDWLVFPKMGAYAASTGSRFNGFDTGAISTYLAYSNPS